jgi:hypothetical protein
MDGNRRFKLHERTQLRFDTTSKLLGVPERRRKEGSLCNAMPPNPRILITNAELKIDIKVERTKALWNRRRILVERGYNRFSLLLAKTEFGWPTDSYPLAWELMFGFTYSPVKDANYALSLKGARPGNSLYRAYVSETRISNGLLLMTTLVLY